MTKRRIIPAALDWLTVFISFLLSFLLQPYLREIFPLNGETLSVGSFVVLSILSSTFFLLIFIWQGVYRVSHNTLALEESRRLLRSSIMAYGLILLPFFYIQHIYDGRLFVTMSIALVMLLLFMQKSLLGMFITKHRKYKPHGKRLLIIGAENEPEVILNKSVGIWSSGYNPVGFLSENTALHGVEIRAASHAVRASVPVLAGYDQLERIALEMKVDEILLNDRRLSQQQVDEYFQFCHKHGIVCSKVSVHGSRLDKAVEAKNLGGLVVIREKQLTPRPLFSAGKRMFDLFAAITGLVLFLPVFFIFGIWIKLDSPGSILFIQYRVGLDGKQFKMFKFRTMFTDTPPFKVSPNNHEDPRITKAGRILRRTSIDELPQLINVLIGNMSMVGPRPEMPFIVEQYNNLQRFRLAIIPGITGLWQISADRAYPIHLNLDYDLYYIDNRSLLLDMVILWRTLGTALRGI